MAVLVPAHNEEEMLAGTLRAAVREVGREHVYVADDASTDRTAEIAYSWAGNVHTQGENAGKSRALRAAITRFSLTDRYDAVFILDADTLLAPGHIEALLPHLEDGVAFVVGRIESAYSENFWTRYRAYVMWQYNAIIRVPQAALNVINVLPGSSVLLASRAVEAVDWERAARLILDDFSMLCDVQYGGIGGIRYVHDSPPAYIDEPKSWAAYKRQTWGRWWPGIWQTVMDRRMWARTDWFSVTNNLQLLGWSLSALGPVLALLWVWWFFGGLMAWTVPIFFLGGLAQMGVLASIYAVRTGRVSVILLLPAFLAVAYVESLFFAASVFKAGSAGGGAWLSPERR